MILEPEDNFKPEESIFMSKCRIKKNLTVVSLGFFLLFCAFQSLSSLQTTINRQGSMSQSVVYAAFVVSSLLFPKLVIRKLGCKIALVLCILTYVPFMISTYFRDVLSLLLTSTLTGLGGAILWSSGCTYINEISALYASQCTESVDVTTTKFFGIFFMIFQNSQIWGNLASFLVLQPSSNETSAVVEDAKMNCGVNFCGDVSERRLSEFSEMKRMLLCLTYLSFTVMAAVFIAIFLDPIKRKNSDEDENVLCSKLAATLKLMKKPNQILMIPATIFMGFEQAFILSEYSQGYVACAWGISYVSLVFICFGVVNAASAFFTGRVSKYVPRVIILITGAAGNVAACAIMFLWIPDDSNAIYFFIIIGLWGISDAIWQTAITAMYGILFRKDEEAAFGNLRLWEAVGFFIPYSVNRLLCMRAKLYIVLAILAVGLLGCIFVEIKIYRRLRDSPDDTYFRLKLKFHSRPHGRTSL